MDRVIRHAISVGIPPITALQMATINTAEYFGVSRNMGMIAPGRYADILLVKDLNDFHAGMVFCRGELIAENGKISIEMPAFEYPDPGLAVRCISQGRSKRRISDWRFPKVQIGSSDGECDWCDRKPGTHPPPEN